MKNKRIPVIGITFIMAIFAATCAAQAAMKADIRAAASSCNAPYESAASAVDGDPATSWVGAAGSEPWSITADLGEAKYVNSLDIEWGEGVYATDFDILASSDGNEWQEAATGLSGETATDYSIDADARYIKVIINSASSDKPAISEIGLYVRNDIPKTMRFQGKLSDNSGAYLNGDYDISLALYDRETGGEALWQETQKGVSVKDGILDLVLGSVNELDLMFDRPYYLGIEIEKDGEMSPRFALGSSPYSYSVEN